MRLLMNYGKSREKSSIYFFENKRKTVFIYNPKTVQAFSINKNSLIEKVKGKICLGYQRNINNLSVEERKIVIKELGLSENEDSMQESFLKTCKISINLNDLVSKFPFYHIFLRLINLLILYFSLPIFGLGLLFYYLNGHQYKGFKFSAALVVIFIIGILGSVLIHELAHALTAIYYDAFVPEIGFKLARGKGSIAFPIFYTSIIGRSSIDKSDSIKIILAGPFANLLIAGISLICYSFNHTLFFLLAVINILMAVTNCTTLLHTDAYCILEEIFDYKNLDAVTYYKILDIKNRKSSEMDKENIIYLVTCFLSIMVYFSIFLMVLLRVF